MRPFLMAWCPPGCTDQDATSSLLRASTHEERLLVTSVSTPPERSTTEWRGLYLSGNVRLDDRGAVLRLLPASDHGAASDQELVLRAWRSVGSGVLEHLTGAFGFAMWDSARAALLVVRDHLGLQPVYWTTTPGGSVLVGSDPQLLLAHPQVDARLDNRAVLAEFVNEGRYLLSRSLHLAIAKVPPASVLHVEPGRTEVREYWIPKPMPVERSPEAWVEGLAERVRVAVAAAVEGEGPYGAHLSGGLDSAAVSCHAQRVLLARGQALLGVWSWSPPPPDKPVDGEHSRIARLAMQLGAPLHHTALTAADLRRSMSDALQPGVQTDLLHEELVADSAARTGVKVMLSGWGGDEFASFNGRGLMAWQLRQRRYGWAARGAYARSTGAGPRRMVRAARTLVRQHQVPDSPWVPREIEAAMGALRAQGWDVRDVLPDGDAVIRAAFELKPPAAAATTQLELLGRGHLTKRIETWAHAGSRVGLEYRYPLLDRRVVEYAVSIPDAVHLRGGSRWVFRAAVQDLVGSALAWGQLKQEPAKWSAQAQLLSQVEPELPQGDADAARIAQWWFRARRELIRLSQQ